ncbi:nardilysin-like isoform X4 [Ostrinia furnacalis]|uniref:nardilysin-like isoform X1 n=2 Tax=Ostrinia furnacalis TaxID=93504 RepID=UPI00103FFBAC|nr:nardilysin-like isoform X1 [Ostrinia furnacalis]XP_028157649.1 nardilysin-like isoform X2 [Ostrinia furnacalis]XP_028157650.1 nardilysin-like isoform X3 [Ostrinia furnacalis]XP_028157651.1 nardilysin-like isoform X4 [Ostrinia furnacalis]
MSKFLSLFIQKTSVFLKTNPIIAAMSRRSGFHRAPKFKPDMKLLSNATRPFVMSSKKEKVEVLRAPIKSESDKKVYKTIRLENGLTALLISDPSRPSVNDDNSSSEEESSSAEDTSGPESDGFKSDQSGSSDQHGTKRRGEFDEEKMAACALSVSVGSYSDPPDIQGLAHFVEHMVFMGSEKYPKENDFDSFIKKKGGSDNASTDCESTTFYFEIQEKHLPQAMDMFSQFFVSPLMRKEAMQREREAIESEFAIAHPSDSNRKDQLLSSTFPAGHPARTFTWGNLQSLRDDIQDDDRLYQAAHDFRKRHYSAHRMTVAVQARMDLDALENYVVSTFGQIPTNKLPPDDFTQWAFKPDYVTPQFRGIFYVKPVGDTTEVHLTWCMRSLKSEYQSKPHQYISFLLGHEGKGSLLSYLRKKVWALGIYTGNSESGIDYTSMYSLFSTQIVLTKNGLEHVDEVLEALFSYIHMLKHIGPSERIFNEIKTIEETGFRFDEESQPSDYVEMLAENMHHYPPEHYITGDRLYYKYDPKGITELLDCMRADNVNIMILSNKHAAPVPYDSKEKWFSTQYLRKDVPKDWLHRWLSVEPYPSFHLPEENVYITTDFDLIEPAEPYVKVAHKLGLDLSNNSVKDIHKKVSSSPEETQVLTHGDLIATVNNFRLDQPNLIRKNRHMEVWYKPDFKFRFPTALLYFYFITPLSLKSPREACLMDLWNDVLQQGLKEEVYPANMADLLHSMYVSDKGIAMKVQGYSQNLHLLVDMVTREMRGAATNLSSDMFEAVRDVRARSYHNVLLRPHKLAKDVRMNILLERYISLRDKAMLVQNVTLEELRAFSESLLDHMYMQVLVQGNVPWHEAIRISENVRSNIKFEGLLPEEMPVLKVHQLPLGEHKIRVLSLNPVSSNSIVTNYYQTAATTPKETAILEVIMMLMEEPVFDMLRTKEQLGYSVFSMMRYTFGVLGYSITVNTQVDKFSVAHVDARVEVFLRKFARDMRKLSERSLQTTKTALVQLKHTTDYELKEEVERNWREIVSMEYEFQRHFIEADAIEQVKTSDIRAFVENNFATGNRSRYRKLSVQVMGNKVDNKVISPPNQMKNYNLRYLDASQPIGDTPENNANFIMDMEAFKKDLPIYDIPKVELGQC